VARGVASFEEIVRFWNLNDVLRWHEILDAQDDDAWFNRPQLGGK
jgi:hypothetical protein